MASKMKFQLNRKGVRDLMRSPEMKEVIESHARAMQGRAGDGYTVRYGKSRTVAFVETGSDGAAQDNLDNNTLLKAVK